MSTLYHLRTDYDHVLNMLYDEDYDEQTVIDTLDSIEDVIEDKAEAYGFMILNVEGDIKCIKEEEARLAKRRKTLENKKDAMKNNLYLAMKTVGRKEIKTPLFSFNIQKNGGKRALVLDVEPDQLPEEFQKITVSANNDALRELLGEAEACAYCHLAEQGEGLRIR